MNQEQARENMVKQQVRTWEVTDDRVLELMQKYPREEFVPESWRDLAYADTNIVLGKNSYMLFPGLEARMLQALDIQKDELVLEIGTGCAYLTAILSDMAASVSTLDTADYVKPGIRENLKNIEFLHGDIDQGWQDKGNFDVVILNGSVASVPAELIEKLNSGGRLFAVTGDAPAMSATLVLRTNQGMKQEKALFETSLPRLSGKPEKEIFTF
jgi:protein-L-isoaspartate(D-aspartate) O-methyltransferase